MSFGGRLAQIRANPGVDLGATGLAFRRGVWIGGERALAGSER
jgi:hypothetical protein